MTAQASSETAKDRTTTASTQPSPPVIFALARFDELAESESGTTIFKSDVGRGTYFDFAERLVWLLPCSDLGSSDTAGTAIGHFVRAHALGHFIRPNQADSATEILTTLGYSRPESYPQLLIRDPLSDRYPSASFLHYVPGIFFEDCDTIFISPADGSDEEEASIDLSEILARAQQEAFEPGMDSEFSEALRRSLRDAAPAAWRSVHHQLWDQSISPETICEALRHFGYWREAETHRQRLELLIAFLRHSSAIVRDTAALALTFLADRQAIEPLREAVSVERSSELKEDLRKILEDLELRTP